MQLYKHGTVFIARTNYGEWAAKNAGFKWQPAEKVWVTTDPQKALQLAAESGLTYLPYEQMIAPTPAPQAAPMPHSVPVDKWPKVLEGKYAILDPADRVLKFYQVDKPQEGKWAGFTFLKVFASDNKFPIKDPQTKAAILDRISQEPLEAMARYGQHIGSCGYCGRTLTDETSRKIGIGPICRGKLGYGE